MLLAGLRNPRISMFPETPNRTSQRTSTRKHVNYTLMQSSAPSPHHNSRTSRGRSSPGPRGTHWPRPGGPSSALWLSSATPCSLWWSPPRANAGHSAGGQGGQLFWRTIAGAMPHGQGFGCPTAVNDVEHRLRFHPADPKNTVDIRRRYEQSSFVIRR